MFSVFRAFPRQLLTSLIRSSKELRRGYHTSNLAGLEIGSGFFLLSDKTKMRAAQHYCNQSEKAKSYMRTPKNPHRESERIE